ncbi:hypothetical protein VTO73DRAFT_10095 [Trametes versicolor]
MYFQFDVKHRNCGKHTFKPLQDGLDTWWPFGNTGFVAYKPSNNDFLLLELTRYDFLLLELTRYDFLLLELTRIKKMLKDVPGWASM